MNVLSGHQIKILDVNQSISFDCGHPDLNEFFTQDASLYQRSLLAKTYKFIQNNDAIALFSVCNDSISLSNSKKESFPESKRLRAYPTVKIARLGVSSAHQKKKIGSAILEFLKIFFIVRNKTGCRFITVDAYNESRVINFYQNNGLELLTTEDKNKKTRVMYYDLLLLHNSIEKDPALKGLLESKVQGII